ncbi:Retrieval of early ER protein Rer1 [Artemisia annua]|uniref:Retrieval of early ER protein Rer1 n=1 Tax=Artemisia annua TaxID=35608 RepID=A0A2U1MQY8_ARTAN|nr:Retrieval of early ER protein Rer1 [Artemisia annua]
MILDQNNSPCKRYASFGSTSKRCNYCTDRVLDRTSFHSVIADADDVTTITTKGQRTARELGFDLKVMKGNDHESLYRAVFYVQGFYIVTYGLGIYILNLLIGFLSPLVDPEVDPSDGPMLPTKGSDEFKPFIRRLPEFKFWYAITKAFIISIMMTFFSMFDIPVFWPILLCYWFVLFTLTMKKQIMHMIKYKYVPFSIGKQKYGKVSERKSEFVPVEVGLLGSKGIMVNHHQENKENQ